LGAGVGALVGAVKGGVGQIEDKAVELEASAENITGPGGQKGGDVVGGGGGKGGGKKGGKGGRKGGK
jgi:hypothetical protein